jgi:DNA polymerase III delta prime subunit
LKDVVGNTETVERLKVIAQDGNMPHIIISVSEHALFMTPAGNLYLLRDPCRGHPVSAKQHQYIVSHTLS